MSSGASPPSSGPPGGASRKRKRRDWRSSPTSSTIDLRVDYLRPGKGAWFDASAEVIRTGKRVVVTRMEMLNDESTLIAVGTGTYIVGV